MVTQRLAVFIGRFQPLHVGHVEVIRKALLHSDHVLVLVGSSNQARSIKNPFSYAEREEMIKCSFPGGNVTVRPLRDHFYVEDLWVKQVRETVQEVMEEYSLQFPVLVGSKKDASSYYLKYFEDYEQELGEVSSLNASDIRSAYFSGPESLGRGWEDAVVSIRNAVPEPVFQFLEQFSRTESYRNLVEEKRFIEDYKRMWSDSPFPVIFSTVDAVVTRNGRVLVVKRKFNPGKGKFALPGGFIKPGELLLNAAIRELREETRIQCSQAILRSSLKRVKVFDHPERSSRGRTITHAHHFDLSSVQDFISVRGSDDAAEAKWMDFAELYGNELNFFEDHAQIIEYFYLSGDR